MRLLQRLIGLVRRPMAERGARGKGLERLAAELEASAASMDARLASAADTPGNRDAIAHWVGIERWGQRRLRVALGEPFVEDGHRRAAQRPRGPDGRRLAGLPAAAPRAGVAGAAARLSASRTGVPGA